MAFAGRHHSRSYHSVSQLGWSPIVDVDELLVPTQPVTALADVRATTSWPRPTANLGASATGRF